MPTARRAKARKAQCPYCSKTFTRTEHLQRHLGSHGVGQAVRCPECGKEFMRKDVLKRHLSKCQNKPASLPGGSTSAYTDESLIGQQQSPPYTQSTNTPQQDSSVTTHMSLKNLSQSSFLHIEAHSSTDEPEIMSAASTNATEFQRINGTQFAMPPTPTSETPWHDININFDEIQFWFDPAVADRDEQKRMSPQGELPLPNGFGLPCLNIDPADTFNFLALVASRETASLEMRYGCSAYEIGCSDELPHTVPAAALNQVSNEIVQQIKDVSQHSLITHTWKPQLEKDCARFFSPRNISRFLSIYWTAWHPHYPVIHKPTFSITDAPVHLAAAMCIIGACFSSNQNDRVNAKLWLNSVEEIVFADRYFGDVALLDGATINIRDVVRLLQAAYCISTVQISEGSHFSRRRIRRARFSMLVSLARDLNLFSTMHRNLDQVYESDFCWDSFIATEECIRTMLFIYIYDTGFTIFTNYPPRTRVQEMALDMACPEACFQATTAHECFEAVKTWTSHPLWEYRIRLCQAVEVILCRDMDADLSSGVQAYMSHLGILNLWIICSAIVSETLQINSLLSISSSALTPLRRAIHTWKVAWNQRYVLTDNFGLPKEEEQMLSPDLGRPANSWRRVGFFQNAAEYWLLVHVLIKHIEERQRIEHSQVSGVTCASSRYKPYAPSRCGEAAMVDLKNLILEHEQHRATGMIG
ncbi:hypothetical protein BDW74DRAFT_185949 [Aspergillus multicolor]|uniref:fungal specific transcription factor domain-containing protein n=1 Tax=Aspergillus multicolor TaxID=41759 RepID=UPI003CCD4773